MSGAARSWILGRMANSTTPDAGAKQFWRHTGLLAVLGAIIAFGLGAAYLSIGHDPQPRDLPIAVVGPPAAAEALEAKAPEELSARAVPDLAAARKAIGERDVYGAVVPGPLGAREVLIASAASNQVANFLRHTAGQATPEKVPRVVDAAPLPDDDSGGSSIPLLVSVLVLGGSVGVVGMSRVLPRFEARPRQGVLPLSFLLIYALVFGLGLTAISAAFGVGTDAAVIDRVLVLSLISLAVTASTAALIALIGPAGSAVTSVLYFVLGGQINGGSTAPEFLPPFWKELGEHLPGGAGVSLLRDVFYFPEASSGQPLAVLGAYAGAGLIVLVALYLVHARRRVRVPVPTAA
jgi:hypothetical protein